MADLFIGATGTGTGAGNNASNLKPLSEAMTLLVAGENGLLHDTAGTYTSGIVPSNNGSSGSLITFKNAVGHSPVFDFSTDISNLPWVLVKTTADGYKIYKATYGSGIYDPVGIVVDDRNTYPTSNWLERFSKDATNHFRDWNEYPLKSLSRAWNRWFTGYNWYAPGDPLSDNSLGCNSSFMWYNGELYLRMPEGDLPSLHTVKAFNKNPVGPTTIGVNLANKSYIRIEGLAFHNMMQWVSMQLSTGCEINSNMMVDCVGYVGIQISGSSYCKVENNTCIGSGDFIAHSGDTISILDYTSGSYTKSHHNLIRRNIVDSGAHAAITCKNSSYNIIEENWVSWTAGKSIQVFSTATNQAEVDNDLHNVVWGNKLFHSFIADMLHPQHWADHGGISLSSQKSIAAFNQIWDSPFGIDTSTSNAAPVIFTGQRIAHNVAWNNQPTRSTPCGGFHLNTDYSQRGMKIYNNIALDTKHAYQYGEYPEGMSTQNQQLSDLNTFDAEIKNNCFYYRNGDNSKIFIGNDLATVQANPSYSARVSGNINVDPLLTDLNSNTPDFRPLSGSPVIGVGRHLTTTTGAYSGNTLTVDDPTWFHAGHGLTTGVSIKVGANVAVTITAINYDTGVITHDGSISGSAGDGVNYANAMDTGETYPNMGAFTYSGSTPVYDAVNDTHTVDKNDGQSTIYPLANDLGMTRIDSIIYSGNSSITINGTNDAILYTPEAGLVGTEVFYITVSNGVQQPVQSTISVTINDPGTIPDGGLIMDNTDVAFEKTGSFVVASTLSGKYSTDYEIVSGA